MSSLAKQLIEENIKTKNPTLDLGNCGLDGTEPELELLAECEHLETLIFSNEWLWYFLDKMSVSPFDSKNIGQKNQLIKLPYKLPVNLKVFICGGDAWNQWKIDCLSSLMDVNKLKYLDMENNNIQDVSILENFEELRFLNLRGNNKIKSIKPIKKLLKLNSLLLQKNQIQKITKDIIDSFPNLEQLYLYDNPIYNIPKEIYDDTHDLPRIAFQYEPEYNCIIKLRNYLQDLEKGKTKNNEVKVILIGNGSVGKTQIAKRLKLQKEFIFDDKYNSTHAIGLLQTNIDCDFLEEGLQVNLWDFGGQDIYHATHRLFMQTRALFLLVWDAENEVNPYHEWEGVKYKNEKLRYWLEYASFFGQNSPILVVQNKVDTEAQEDLGIPQPEQDKLKAEFPNITEFWQSSAKTGHNFEELEYFIAETFENNENLRQDLIERELPISWIEVRNRVREEQAKDNGEKQITFETFETWCAEAEVKDSAPTILAFFHDTGVLYYQKQYFGGHIILNQAWAIEAVYQILDRKKGHYKIIQKRNGQLDYKWLCKIWKQNTDAERKLFMDFMLSTEMCFETSKDKSKLANRRFVVPQMLKDDKPSYIKDYQAQYQITEIHKIAYRFLPAVFIQRFMVQVKDFADTKDMWQAGIYLSYQNKLAVVEADYENSEILIHYQAEGKELLEAIKELLKAIQNNEQISAQEGNKDIFQQFLEKFYQDKSDNNIKVILKQTLTHLEEADYPAYFDAMDKAKEQMSASQKNLYATHKKRFMSNRYDVEFFEQLVVFVNELMNQEKL